jgi:hypothetical protein
MSKGKLIFLGALVLGLHFQGPAQARFVETDPAGQGGGENIYVYGSNNPVFFVDPFGLRELSSEERQQLSEAARDWGDSSVPYLIGGKTKKGADCSGSVWGVYNQAGFPFNYSNSVYFPTNPRFVPVPPNTQPGPMDVGLYPGHMVIYDPNAGPNRNVWSASHPGGRVFGPGNSSWYLNLGPVQWFRYDVPENSDCTPKPRCP